MFWAIDSLQGFYGSRRKNHRWKSSSPGPIEQKVQVDLLPMWCAIRLFWQVWSSCSAPVTFPCKATASPDTWNIVQKSSWLLRETLCTVCSSEQMNNLMTAREKPVQRLSEISVVHWWVKVSSVGTQGSGSVGSCLERELLTNTGTSMNKQLVNHIPSAQSRCF